MATFPILRPSPATLRRRPESRAKQTSLTLFPQAARHGNRELPSGASAPPPAPDRSEKPATELVGIARLAASSPCAEAKRGTEKPREIGTDFQLRRTGDGGKDNFADVSLIISRNPAVVKRRNKHLSCQSKIRNRTTRPAGPGNRLKIIHLD